MNAPGDASEAKRALKAKRAALKAEREPECKRLGARVKELREAAGLTQAEVAEAIQGHRVTVARLESGTNDIGASRLGALAAALGVEPGAFWE